MFYHRQTRRWDQAPSSLWRECIRKVFEVDPLICPSCNGEMRIIGFITEWQVIRRIIGTGIQVTSRGGVLPGAWFPQDDNRHGTFAGDWAESARIHWI